MQEREGHGASLRRRIAGAPAPVARAAATASTARAAAAAPAACRIFFQPERIESLLATGGQTLGVSAACGSTRSTGAVEQTPRERAVCPFGDEQRGQGRGWGTGRGKLCAPASCGTNMVSGCCAGGPFPPIPSSCSSIAPSPTSMFPGVPTSQAAGDGMQGMSASTRAHEGVSTEGGTCERTSARAAAVEPRAHPHMRGTSLAVARRGSRRGRVPGRAHGARKKQTSR